MAKASDELLRVDQTTNPPTARLKDEVRKLCSQLLGPPPEQWDQYYRHPNGEPDALHAQKMAELRGRGPKPQSKKNRKSKRNESETPPTATVPTGFMHQYREARAVALFPCPRMMAGPPVSVKRGRDSSGAKRSEKGTARR